MTTATLDATVAARREALDLSREAWHAVQTADVRRALRTSVDIDEDDPATRVALHHAR